MSDEVTRQAAEIRAQKDDITAAHVTAQQLLGQTIQERDDWRAEASRLNEAGRELIVRLNAAQSDVDRLTAERDAAREEVVQLRAECDGLRADLLAHPPEVHQELAIERKRHLELSEEYDRQQVIITKLDDALRRTENALKTAQVKRIDPRLKGLLSVLSRMASEAEEMLP